MAKVISNNVSIFLGFNTNTEGVFPIDLGTATRTWTLSEEVETLDATVITSAGERTISGKRKDGFEWSGIFDDGTSLDSILGTMGTGTVQILTLLGTSVGKFGYAISPIATEIKPATKLGELVAQTAKFRTDGSIERGVLLSYKEVFGASGSAIGTIFDNGTQTTNGAVVYFYSFSGSAWGGNVQIEHSTSSTGGWGTIAGIGGGVGSAVNLRQTASGTVFRYLRQTATTGVGQITITTLFVRL